MNKIKMIVAVLLVLLAAPAVANDEIYKSIKLCMDLQYSFRDDYLPSHTGQSVKCLCDAEKKYGVKVVSKNIAIWMKVMPRSIAYMTLVYSGQKDLYRKLAQFDKNEANKFVADIVPNNALVIWAQANR